MKIETYLKNLDTIEDKEMLGNTVFDKNGADVGSIAGFYINTHTLQIEGIRVDKGIFKEDHFIGRSYIESISEEGVLLKIVPYDEYLGKKVIDIKGRRIGNIKKIKRSDKTNKAESFIISREMGKNDLILDTDLIHGIGEAVLLKTEVQD